MPVTLIWGDIAIPPAGTINSVGAGADARQLTVAGQRSVVPLVYGEDRLGALVLNVLPSASDPNVLLVQCLWGFACDAIADVKLNDQDLPAGSTVTHYTGGQSSADAALVAAFAAKSIAYGDTLAGYAYSVVALPVREFTGQLNITARVRGRRLYDPRKDSTAGGSGAHRLADPATWEWSDTPALALADFCYSSLYGLGRTVDWSSVPAAANANEALVAGTEKRRLLGVAFITAQPAIAVAETLRAYASCFLLPTASGLKLLADADGAAVASYDHGAGQIAALDDLAKRDLGNTPTAVEILYTDRSTLPWRDGTALAALPGAGTTLPWRLSQVRLPGVQRYSQAYREAVERLNKLTLGDLTCTLEVFDIGIRHEVGDIVEVTHPVGLAAKKMRIAGAPEMPAHGRWRLPLVEHDPAVYSDAVQSAPSVPDTGLVNPAGPPAQVAGFSFAFEPDGTRLRWTANAERDVIGYVLRVGGTDWASALPIAGGGTQTLIGATTYLWPPVAAGSYVVRIKARDNEGLESTAEATVAVTVAAAQVLNLQAAFNARSLVLTWSAQAGSFRIDRFRVRRGASFGSAQLVDEPLEYRYETRADWAGSENWYITALDAAGNESAPASVAANIAAPAAPAVAVSVLTNRVVLTVTDPTQTLPIEKIELRKGAQGVSWASATPVGVIGPARLASFEELTGGTYDYLVRATDSAGNEGAEGRATAVVSDPPAFRRFANYDGNFSLGTRTNCLLETTTGKLLAPINDSETEASHYSTRSWATDQDKINAGYAYIAHPTAATGSYEESVDIGQVVTAAKIDLTLTSAALVGSVSVSPRISYKLGLADPWTDGPAGQASLFAQNFRYVKYRYDFTSQANGALGQYGVLACSGFNGRLSTERKTDSGAATVAAGDTGGTLVTFNRTDFDIAPKVTCNSGEAGLGYYAEVDDGATTKTTCRLFLFDAGGVRKSGKVIWSAEQGV